MTFKEICQPLARTPEVQKLKTEHHHRHVNRYDHSVHVARLSYQWAKKLGWDAEACARAGMLHDLFMWRKFTDREKWTPFPVYAYQRDAIRNARKLTKLSKKEENIILSHMFPLSLQLPRSKEAWLVTLVDKIVAAQDMFKK